MHKRYFIILLVVILGVFVGLLLFFWKTANSKIKSQDGRVNVLILGKGDVGHAGADLTDTMMFASVSLERRSANLISIPRDIWIPEIRAKINSAYYWGKEQPQRGGGLNFSKETTSAILGQPVHYALVVDFSVFEKIVDAISGIDVNIEKSFTDSMYPIAGREEDTCDGEEETSASRKEFKCRYEVIHFEKGVNYMDGVTALKYVRSRNGDNNENTDIAREARQQRVISAIKGKVLSSGTLLNPFKLFKVWKVVKSSIETDVDFSSMLILGKEALTIDGNIHSSTVPDGILISPPKSQRYDYQYVFTPKVAGDWSELQSWIKDLIK